jgi:hypothetical protein
MTTEDKPSEKSLAQTASAERPAFAPTRIEDAFGCLVYTGPARSIAEMDEAALRKAARRYAASRAR